MRRNSSNFQERASDCYKRIRYEYDHMCKYAPITNSLLYYSNIILFQGRTVIMIHSTAFVSKKGSTYSTYIE